MANKTAFKCVLSRNHCAVWNTKTRLWYLIVLLPSSCLSRMPSSQTNLFYSQLPVQALPLGVLFTRKSLFSPVPADWHVVITDVRKSTAAVTEGLHENVNLIATGSIVAVLNIVYREGLSIPYFFGGDGATFVLPPALLPEVLRALTLHQEASEKNFGLYLRVGQVPVAEIYAAGEALQLSKLQTTGNFTIPVMLGTGLAYAEKIVKGEDYLLSQTDAQALLDLSGMQCRWDRIRPPATYDEVVSLIVIAGRDADQAAVFKSVIDAIENIYGTPEKRTPISVQALKLKATLQNIGREIRVRLGKKSFWSLLKTWVTTLIGPLYFKTRKGKNYLDILVEMSDTLVIDGRINTVISGTALQREQLEKVLDRMEESHKLMYGLHVSNESVLSCYVRDMNHDHVHFVDGSEGGYTQAAGMMKRKMAGL